MTTNKVIASFQAASKRMVADVRADLKSLDVAETQATTKAMAAVDALPEVNRIIQPMSWYLTLGHGSKKAIIDGPFKLRSSVGVALRNYVRKNPTVNPLYIYIAMGRMLRTHGTPFSPDYVPRPGAKRSPAQVKTKRLDPVRVKAQQDALRKRRLLSRANSLVMRATAPVPGKLYVVDDKTNMMLSGPYSTHRAALATMSDTDNDQVMLCGRHCSASNIDYSRKFKAVVQPKMHSHFFAEDQHVLVDGKRAKITAVDNKAKTVTVNIKSGPAGGTVVSQQAFTINYASCMLVLNTK